IAMLIFSFDKSASSKTGSLTGRVILVNDTGDPAIDQEDMSGITVALYLPSLLDSTICRINAEHGHIGIELNQENSFDHIWETPWRETTTGSDGSFRFNDIKLGSYNLVARKDGWGEVFRTGVQIAKNGQYQRNPLATEQSPYTEKHGEDNISLYPIVDLYSNMPHEFVFKEDHVYHAGHDITFSDRVIFEGGSIVRIGPRSNITFMSDLVCDPISKYTLFTSFTGDPNSRWNSIKVFNQNQNLSKLVLRNGETGLELHGNQSSIKNSFFDNLITGIYAHGEDIEASNLIFKDISNRGLYLDVKRAESNDIKYELHNNIFLRASIGLRTQGQPISIMHNYFIDCTKAIMSFSGFHKIERNSFDRNIDGITCIGTQIDIKDNNFFDNDNSIIFLRMMYVSTSNPKIFRNNFFQNNGYAIALGTFTTMNNIDATNNYWLYPDIEQLIYDMHDFPVLGNEVIYLPKSISRFDNAGV
ncbi:MAG: carboxypeptidase-like regulatory domain-containing protein, partial [Candidatus Cloacimonetes bacterium]|nr:carboxypeptidase-like regulatory domain-containing protein [Candidatus Cloacimonadota bacterium]